MGDVVASLDSFGAKSQLQVGEESFEVFRLDALGELDLPAVAREMPVVGRQEERGLRPGEKAVQKEFDLLDHATVSLLVDLD